MVRRREGNRVVLKHERHLVSGNFRSSLLTVPSGIELRMVPKVKLVLMGELVPTFFSPGEAPHDSEISREFSTKFCQHGEKLFGKIVFICYNNTLNL